MKFEIETGDFGQVADIAATCLELSEVDIYPEGHSEMNSGGIYFKQADKASVIILEGKMPPASFNEVTLPDSPLKIGIDWERVSNVVERINDPSVSIEYDDNRHQLIFTTDSGFHYEMSLINVDSIPQGESPSREIDFDVPFRCTVNDLKHAADTCGLVGSGSIHIEIVGEGDDKRAIGWSSGDTDEVEEPITPVTDNNLEPAHSEFGISVVTDFLRCLQKDNTLDVGLHYDGGRGNGRNYPMEITTELGETTMSAMFAPRN